MFQEIKSFRIVYVIFLYVLFLLMLLLGFHKALYLFLLLSIFQYAVENQFLKVNENKFLSPSTTFYSVLTYIYI